MRCGTCGKLYFGHFCRFPESCHGLYIITNIYARFILKTLCEVIKQLLVHVGAAQLGVTAGGLDFKYTFAKFHYGDIQCAATKINNGNLQFFACSIQTIGEGSGCWLVHQSGNFNTGDMAGILGGIALIVIKIGGYRHYCFFDLFTEKSFCITFNFLQ